MRQSLYISSKAMDISMEKMAIISNNLSNVNTSGYKKDKTYVTSFQDKLANKIDQVKAASVPDSIKMSIDFSAGNYRFTGEKFNMAIEGEGLFKVQLPDESIAYTRKGAFRLNAKNQLTVGKGEIVMGQSGPIVLANKDFNVDSQGNIYDSEGIMVSNLGIVTFEDLSVLEKKGGTLFVVRDGVEANEIAADGNIKQQYIEESNVDALSSMVEMIGLMESMRSYETQQKIVQLQDGITDKVINQVGRI